MLVYCCIVLDHFLQLSDRALAFVAGVQRGRKGERRARETREDRTRAVLRPATQANRANVPGARCMGLFLL